MATKKRTKPEPLKLEDMVTVDCACGHSVTTNQPKTPPVLCPNCMLIFSLTGKVEIKRLDLFPASLAYMGVNFIREDLTKLESVRVDLLDLERLIKANYELISYYDFSPEEEGGLNQIVLNIISAMEKHPREGEPNEPQKD